MDGRPAGGPCIVFQIERLGKNRGMTFMKRIKKRLQDRASAIGAARPKGPLTTRVVELPNGKKMLVMRQATLKAAVKAGEASLRQSRPTVRPS